MNDAVEREHRALDDERWELLERVHNWMETPMVLLALAWLVLLIWELIRGLSSALETLTIGIWMIFIAHFALELALAPRKLPYLKRNWLTAVSLAVPALRIVRALRALQALRALRGTRLLRVIASMNRSMGALGNSMSRRGFGYVAALTVLALLAGAAGMYAFERERPQGAGFRSYSEALWWTAMLFTTMGSSYWPVTTEGRALCLLLSLFALGVFGYLTATMASYFVGRDAEDPAGEVAGAAEIRALRQEIAALRNQLSDSQIGRSRSAD